MTPEHRPLSDAEIEKRIASTKRPPKCRCCYQEWEALLDLKRARERLAEARKRMIRDFYTGTAPESPRWWSCQVCGWNWRDGSAELHDQGCPLAPASVETEATRAP